MRTVPLFDGGKDVGMVLSPQCFHNLNGSADVFNHGNVCTYAHCHLHCPLIDPMEAGIATLRGIGNDKAQHLLSIAGMTGLWEQL